MNSVFHSKQGSINPIYQKELGI